MNFFLKTDTVIFGNDVVDLTDPDTSISHLHYRFIEKICTDKEKSFFFPDLEKSFEKLLLLWKLWAIKEASYKAISRVREIPVFRYKDYEVFPLMKFTRHEKIRFINDVYFERDLNFLLALSYTPTVFTLERRLPEAIFFISWMKMVTDEESRNMSKTTRKFLSGIFHSVFSKKVRICKKFDRNRKIFSPPWLYYNREFLPVSLSHHGRFTLFTLGVTGKGYRMLYDIYSSRMLKISKRHYLILEKS